MNWTHINTKRPPIGSDVYVWVRLRRNGSIRAARPGKVERLGDGIQVHDTSCRITYREFEYWAPIGSLAGPQ